jgi:hypothetical protein
MRLDLSYTQQCKEQGQVLNIWSHHFHVNRVLFNQFQN